MIVDTSALVAIVLREPDYERLLAAITDRMTSAAIGTPTVAELGLVLSSRLQTDARALVRDLLDELQIATVPFADEHRRSAIDAFWRFGRGRHAAGLNFGDCLTYAVAKLAAEPLLFVGDDFTHTDLDAA